MNFHLSLGQSTTKSSCSSPHFQSNPNSVAPHVQGYGNVTVQVSVEYTASIRFLSSYENDQGMDEDHKDDDPIDDHRGNICMSTNPTTQAETERSTLQKVLILQFTATTVKHFCQIMQS